MDGPWITLVGGPTASGKSALALELADRDGAEIVNADSMQVYADLRALTARPSDADEARAPHHLYGVADAAEPWSVGRWLREVLPLLEAIRARGKPAIVVGGTGLYFSALTKGLAEVPPVPDCARAEAAETFDRLGEEAFRRSLDSKDPEAVRRIAPGDRQRLIRAWAVGAHTGRALTDWQADTRPALEPGEWRAVALEPPRAALYERIDARVPGMIEAGALEEVRALLVRGLSPDLPLMKAVGVRALAGRLSGALSMDQAVEHVRQETRRYAKRQLTWFRNQAPEWPRLDPFMPNSSAVLQSRP